MGDQQPEKREKASPAPRPVEADELFKGQREIAIRYQDETYRLRITRNDKLILTK